MKPERVPIKGPIWDPDNHMQPEALEPQMRYEAHDEHKDLVGGEPPQDPTTLKAHEEDHTPNHTRAPKGEKIGWNFQHGRG